MTSQPVTGEIGRQPLDRGRPQHANTADGLPSAQLASLQPSPEPEAGWDEVEDEDEVPSDGGGGEDRRPGGRGAASVIREEGVRLLASLPIWVGSGPQSALGGEREGSP